MSSLEYWDVWYPKGAATGLPFARGRLDPTERLFVHAAPEVLTVEVRSDSGDRLAYGRDLQRNLDTPMCLLTRQGDTIAREDRWPEGDDDGTPVLLPGGEVGILMSWWNAEDLMEWRWQIEFYNSRR